MSTTEVLDYSRVKPSWNSNGYLIGRKWPENLFVELLNSELVYEVLGMLCKRFEELDVATILTLLQCKNLSFPLSRR